MRSYLTREVLIRMFEVYNSTYNEEKYLDILSPCTSLNDFILPSETALPLSQIKYDFSKLHKSRRHNF